MPLVESGNIFIRVHDISVSESALWLSSRFPFRIPVRVIKQKNPVKMNEIITAQLSSRLIELNKVREDLEGFVVTRFEESTLPIVPSVAELVDPDTIQVSFQALQDIESEDLYHIYYGSTLLGDDLQLPEYTGIEYYNSADPDGEYMSFTNPSQDWEIGEDYISGFRPGAKVFSELSMKRFAIIGRVGPDAGIIDIYIGGMFIDSVDLFSDEELLNQNLFALDLPAPGITSVKIEISSQKNVSSSGTVVGLNNIRYDTFPIIEYGSEEINPRLDWMSNIGAK